MRCGLNRQRQAAIDYLKEENRLLKQKLGDRTLRFIDAERRRLASRAKALGRTLLSQLDTLVTPDTLLRWQTRHHPPATALSQSERLRRALRRVDQGGILGSPDLVRRSLTSSGVREYMAHYEHETNHQGIGNRLLVAAANDAAFASDQRVGRRSRLGGMLTYYHREAA